MFKNGTVFEEVTENQPEKPEWAAAYEDDGHKLICVRVVEKWEHIDNYRVGDVFWTDANR